MPILPLPNLTSHPTHHPDSCLSLSLPLLDLLTSTLPSHDCKLLSIGSGSGLLEALLSSSLAAQSIPSTIHGIEPHPGTANKYLTKEKELYLVPGTWAVFGQALEYDVWLFVYPRDRKLVDRYVDLLKSAAWYQHQHQHQQPEGSSNQMVVVMVIWAGPRADWEVFKGCFDREEFVKERTYEGLAGGVAEWEMIVVLRWKESGGGIKEEERKREKE